MVDQTVAPAAAASKRIGGVYAIVSAASGHVYIGSSKYIKARWSQHKHKLRRGDHHVKTMQALWAKHGETSFEFHVLEELFSVDALRDREQFWLDMVKNNSATYVLNLHPSTKSAIGHVVPPETRAKMSAARKGKPKSVAGAAAIRAALVARNKSPEMRAANVNAQKGKKKSDAHRAALSLSATGRIISAETRAKMSVAQREQHARRRATGPCCSTRTSPSGNPSR